MEVAYEGKGCRYLCPGYAASGYTAGQGLAGDIYCRSGFADFVFCRPERAGKHKEAAGGGDSGGKSQRRPVWEAAASLAGKFL